MPGLLAGFLLIVVGRFLQRGSSEAAASGGLPGIPSQEGQVLVNSTTVKFCSSLAVRLVHLKHPR